MDFSNIKKAFSSGVEKAKKTAKGIGDKTLAFANEQISQTGLFLAEQENYDGLIEKNKRVVVIAYDETDQIGKDLVLMLSVWMTKSLIDGSSLRYISIDPDDMPDFAHDLKLQWPIEMRVFYDGRETNRFTTLDEIKQWWDGERIYKVKFVPTKKSAPKKEGIKKTTTQTKKSAPKKTTTSKTSTAKKSTKTPSKTKPKTTRKTRAKKTDNVAPATDPLAEATKK